MEIYYYQFKIVLKFTLNITNYLLILNNNKGMDLEGILKNQNHLHKF
jgi:hypothetical protein